MRNEYVTLNNVQTHLIIWGNPFECDGQDVIICITGNPGITDFYIDFGAELYRNTKLPVCIIGQAGHEQVPDEKSNILIGQEHLFNLEGQIKHKLELIDNYIDRNSKLHLIGHSIGAWIILELVKNNEHLNKRISSVNLLFPTLQRMAETSNGLFLNYVIRRLHLFFIFLFYLAHILPASILTFLVKLYLKLHSLPSYYSRSILKFLKPTVGEKVLYLAYDEMDSVRNLNNEALDKIKHVTNIIYSSHDNWAPVSYMEDLHIYKPEICLHRVDLDHAFVLKSSEKVAGMVTDFIRLKL